MVLSATKVCAFDQLLGKTEMLRDLSFGNDVGDGLCENAPYFVSKIRPATWWLVLLRGELTFHDPQILET